MHNAAFAALGLDMVYVPLRVKAADVPAAIRGLAALGFAGANVTIPHKTAVVPLLTRLEGDAAATGAVNTIVVEGGGLVGHNTDVAGVDAALDEAVGKSIDGEPALVLGAGGAARAVALALARRAMPLTVMARDPAAAEAVAAMARAAVTGARCTASTLAALDAAEVGRYRLLVNATPLGMRGVGKVPGVFADNVTAGQVVFDLVYATTRTDLLAQASARGAAVVDGRAMLLGQAAAAFRLWTGREAPVEVMRGALAS